MLYSLSLIKIFSSTALLYVTIIHYCACQGVAYTKSRWSENTLELNIVNSVMYVEANVVSFNVPLSINLISDAYNIRFNKFDEFFNPTWFCAFGMQEIHDHVVNQNMCIWRVRWDTAESCDWACNALSP